MLTTAPVARSCAGPFGALMRPTHFLALPLPCPSLHSAMARCQAACAAAEPALSRCAVPPEKAHFTFFVFAAPTPQHVEAAAMALDACRPLVASRFPAAPPRVTLSGLDAFGQRVLYAKAAPSADLAQLAELFEEVAAEFSRRGVLAEAAAWTPHLTLLKQSAAGRGAGRPPKTARRAWEALAAEELGTHPIRELSLCAMGGVGEGGFYPVVSSLPLGRAEDSPG